MSFERRVLVGLVCSFVVFILLVFWIQSKNAVHLRVVAAEEAIHEN
jgi:hypothetical protein